MTELIHASRAPWAWQPWAVGLCDLLLVIWVLWLSFRSTRWWPIGVAAALISSEGMGLSYLAAPTIFPITLWTVEALWGYVAIGLLLAGIALEGRRPHTRARRSL